MVMKLNSQFWQEQREAIFPGHKLCRVEFSDGKETNDFIPEDILSDPDRNSVDWFNKHKKDEYIGLLEGTRKAVKIERIPNT